MAANSILATGMAADWPSLSKKKRRDYIKKKKEVPFYTIFGWQCAMKQKTKNAVAQKRWTNTADVEDEIHQGPWSKNIGAIY